MALNIQGSMQFGPSTLAVPEQLSNGGGENVGYSPAESGTDFWALCTTTSATLWPLAKPLLNAGHTYCMSPDFNCSWYIKQCLFAFYLERANSMATNRFGYIIMFDKNVYVWIQFMLIMGVIEDKSWGGGGSALVQEMALWSRDAYMCQ